MQAAAGDVGAPVRDNGSPSGAHGIYVNISIIAKRFGSIMAMLVAAMVLALPAAGAAPEHAKHAAVTHAKAATKTSSVAQRSVAQSGIIWRGDHCSARIFKDLAASYNASGQGKVIVQPFSTISGLDAVHAGSADVAGSARSAMPGRAEELDTNFYPVAWDALVPIVSIDNPVNNISLKDLHDLYLGHITNWKQLGGDDAPINLYAVAAPLDGVEYSTRKLLFHYGDTAVSAPRLYINTVQLEAGVVIDPHGIGMSSLSGVAANKKLKMLSVEGVTATDTSIADGTYPLYSALYLASRSDDQKHAQVSAFIAYAGSDAGKAILRKHDLVPYADAPGLIGMQDERVAFINARVHPPVVAAQTTQPTPVSAPNATAEALKRIAPTSELTMQAQARADRIKAQKAAAKKADAEKASSDSN